MLEAIFFDLDDTLFDHTFACRRGLDAVRDWHPDLGGIESETLFVIYREILEKLHVEVMGRRLSPQAAQMERFVQWFDRLGVPTSLKGIQDAKQLYRDVYLASRKPVEGALELLQSLHKDYIVGIVTNNLLEEQREKLRVCGLSDKVDHLITSEEVGVAKPAPGIFEAALERSGCRASACLMVGDTWTTDILGAVMMQFKALWFNRWDLPCPTPGMVPEVHTLAAVPGIVKTIADKSTATSIRR